MEDMKRQHTLRILFAVVLAAVIAGCETVPSSGPAALAGRWTNSLGTIWTINADGTFHLTVQSQKHRSGAPTRFPATPSQCRRLAGKGRSQKIAEALACISSCDQRQTFGLWCWGAPSESHGFRTQRRRGTASKLQVEAFHLNHPRRSRSIATTNCAQINCVQPLRLHC